jgi:hypothetical protein
MLCKVHLVEHANGTVAVADIEPGIAADQPSATSLRRRLSGRLGGMETLLRCRLGNVFILSGNEHLYRYGVDPIVEVMPTLDIDV